VLGDTLTTSTSILSGDGFSNIPYAYGCYGSANAGDVVQQDPAPGVTIALASPVRLSLQAANCYTIPDVIGLTLPAAESDLYQTGFTNVSHIYACHGSPYLGAVLQQSPAAGTSYGSNQPITVYLQALVSC
jgi:beta-lactam-binding protein with PASTA domain